jgi:7-cyano-7-deazaguanine synthase
MKVIIGLSGGMDSTTLLGFYLEQGFEICCCSFLYGSKHNLYELESASKIIDFYKDKGHKISHLRFDLRSVFYHFTSDLLINGGQIPEGHYEEESMKRTVVPGRNLIMASIMAGIAESINAVGIALGIHAGDHHIYPDCRPGFINKLRSTINESSEGKVQVWAPFIFYTKKDILQKGFSFSQIPPYHLTRTCYKNQPVACGKCGSCQERLEAFKLIGIKDPIEYE